MAEDKDTFHLGLTMAGAVSAGCYTAGVVDYLFEILDLWERAKVGGVAGIDMKLVPKNKVIIEAMGGASAGGMTTIMTAMYAIKGHIEPVKEIPKNPMDNLNVLYNSWVHLDDNVQGKTFDKLWETDDLDTKLVSLFNSKVIDSIASRAIDFVDDNVDFPLFLENRLPKFISKDLEILLSHTLLRGIPLSVDFNTEIARKLKASPKHNTFEHYLVSHFKLNKGEPVDEDHYLWFNPFKQRYSDKIKLSTISTGAFPVGLAYREFDSKQFSDNYIKSVVKRTIYGDFGIENPDKLNKIELENFPQNFESLTIDGGTINNEPYREVGSILKAKFYKKKSDYQNYGLIMIDPFPDNDDIKREYKKPKNLIGVIPAIISTLWNQSKIKRKEMLEQYSTDFFKGIIYPRKHYTNADGTYAGRDKNPLTSASFKAFGGFLDIKFRVHDFFLGRNNARNFVQYFGSFPYEPEHDNVHPIHENWTEEMIERFKIKRKIKGEIRIFLPIIPDLNLLIENKKSGEDRYVYTYKDKPKYNPKKLFALKDAMYKRFRKILDKGVESFGGSKKDSNTPISDTWIKLEFKRNWVQRRGDAFKSTVVGWFEAPVKKAIAKILSKFIIKMVLEDLEEMDILENK